MTYPTAVFHPAQIAILNSIYECTLPLDQTAPQRCGRNLKVGHPPTKFPFLVQGPWMIDLDRTSRTGLGRIENGALTKVNPPGLRRLAFWKKAGVSVAGRPDWLFIKLHTHGMDPTDTDTILRGPMQRFLNELIEGAAARDEVLHFVSAREMANIILAACDGREGNPGDYRDYRYKLARADRMKPMAAASGMAVRGKPCAESQEAAAQTRMNGSKKPPFTKCARPSCIVAPTTRAFLRDTTPVWGCGGSASLTLPAVISPSSTKTVPRGSSSMAKFTIFRN